MEPVIAQKSPFEVSLEEGVTYWWCACGRSDTQPFCSGAHAGTGIEPVAFVAPRTETAWLCGCKHSKDKPFCDGSHNRLEPRR